MTKNELLEHLKNQLIDENDTLVTIKAIDLPNVSTEHLKLLVGELEKDGKISRIPSFMDITLKNGDDYCENVEIILTKNRGDEND